MNDEQQTVNKAPEDEIPRCSVPQPAQKHRHHQSENHAIPAVS